MKKLFKTNPKHGSTQSPPMGTVIPYDPNEPSVTQAMAAVSLVDAQAPLSGSPFMSAGPNYGAAVPPSPDAALAQLATQRQAEYHHHSHGHSQSQGQILTYGSPQRPERERDRTYRNSRAVPVQQPAQPQARSSEDNWEVVQPSDYDTQQGHSPYLERKLSNVSGLPNPHPPVLPTTRSSSLNSLPGVASQPLQSPSALSVQRSASPLSMSSTSPIIPPQTVNAPPIDSHSHSGHGQSQSYMLRKKNRDPIPTSPQFDYTMRSPATTNAGPAAILRALDPAVSSPPPQSIKLVQPRPARPSVEVTPRSPDTEISFSIEDDERDSLEIERERKWRERDMEIYSVPSAGDKKTKRRDKPGLLQKARPPPSEERESSGGSVVSSILPASLSSVTGRHLEREKDREKEPKNLLERFHLQSQSHPDGGDAKKRRDGSFERQDRRRSREVLDLAGSIKDGKEGKEDKKLPWSAFLLGSKDKEKEKSRGRGKDKESEEQIGEELTRMIGFATAVASLDMTLVFEICDRASYSEHCAKQAAKALRRELKYGEPSGQISAARLWGIMLQNCADIFITQTSSRKFLDTLEDLITGSRTPPLVRDALLNALGTAVYISTSRGTKEPLFKEGYRSLWRKLKPPDMPDDGLPMIVEDRTPVTATPYMQTNQRLQHDYRQTNSDPSLASEEQLKQYPRPRVRERLSSRAGIIPVDEDVRRLFQECKIGRGNAALLSEALAFAKPEDLKEKGIIKEFYKKCLSSQELIVAQIPWATAGAERSRAQALESRRSAEIDYGNANANSETQLTREEKLLAELLKANEELAEALKIYADLERIDVEKEIVKVATERSQTETRMNGFEYGTYQDSSSFLLAPSTAPSSSRSPSPTSFQDQTYLDPNAQYSPRTITDLTPMSYNKPTTQPTSRPLPLTNGTRSPQVPNHPSHLPHPARALHGPRMISSSGTRSRSPSPARSLMGSRPASRTHSRNGSLEVDLHRQSEADIGAAGARLPSDINSFQLSEKAAGKRKMVDPEPPNLDDDNDSQSLHLLEAEALGATPQSPTDPTLARYWNVPVRYVYDAAAERTKEWLQHEHEHEHEHDAAAK